MIGPSTTLTRSIDLLDRIRGGMTTSADADWLASRLERLAIYEATLRVVAVHGSGPVAMMAARALAEGRPPRAHAVEADDERPGLH